MWIKSEVRKEEKKKFSPGNIGALAPKTLSRSDKDCRKKNKERVWIKTEEKQKKIAPVNISALALRISIA